jgi:hypothetical protein
LLVANEKIVFKRRTRLFVNHSQQGLLFKIKKKEDRANELIFPIKTSYSK